VGILLFYYFLLNSEKNIFDCLAFLIFNFLNLILKLFFKCSSNYLNYSFLMLVKKEDLQNLNKIYKNEITQNLLEKNNLKNKNNFLNLFYFPFIILIKIFNFKQIKVIFLNFYLIFIFLVF